MAYVFEGCAGCNGTPQFGILPAVAAVASMPAVQKLGGNIIGKATSLVSGLLGGGKKTVGAPGEEAGYVRLAQEEQTFTLGAPAAVTYRGAKSGSSTKTLPAGTHKCSHRSGGAFTEGDPSKGQVKACYTPSAAAVPTTGTMTVVPTGALPVQQTYMPGTMTGQTAVQTSALPATVGGIPMGMLAIGGAAALGLILILSMRRN